MTNDGTKKKRSLLLQAQQALVCLWSISKALKCQKFHGIFTSSTVSRSLCWCLMVLWGRDSADFRPFHREVGGGGEKEEERNSTV